MSWRRVHRWLSALFIITVVVTIVSTAVSGPEWVAYVGVPPLLLLLVTGSYLLVQPYVSERRPRHRSTA